MSERLDAIEARHRPDPIYPTVCGACIGHTQPKNWPCDAAYLLRIAKAAERLANSANIDEEFVRRCPWCRTGEKRHAPACPWPALHAALEAE